MSVIHPDAIGDALYHALRRRAPIAPLTQTYPGLTINDAYHISRRMTGLRVRDGERIVGKKIGVTSAAVQNMLGVRQPDFGWLTDAMVYPDGAELPISKLLIQPRAEGEIAFILRDELQGPGITERDVLEATLAIRPCFEIVDSRIRDWKIRIEDTVADNASCGLLVLGEATADPRELNLETIELIVQKNGRFLSQGVGAAALGSPLKSVAWLANTLGGFGIALEAGEIVLSGSLVPLEPVVAGDFMTLTLGGVGEASVRFA